MSGSAVMSEGGGFAPNIVRHGGKEGDPRTRELYEQWAKVADAEQELRAAVEARVNAETRLQYARNAETDCSNRLRGARAALEKLLGESGKP